MSDIAGRNHKYRLFIVSIKFSNYSNTDLVSLIKYGSSPTLLIFLINEEENTC